MSETTLNWRVVDDIAAELGAKREARLKWRQRGVPADWKIKVTQTLMSRGVPIALSDFDTLATNPGRIAA
jgi:hypothetical protein